MGSKKSKSASSAGGVASNVADKSEQASRLAGLSSTEVSAAQAAFDRFDTNGNGRLEVDELTGVLQALHSQHGRDIKDEDSALALFDVDLSGTITFDEFIAMYKAWWKADTAAEATPEPAPTAAEAGE